MTRALPLICLLAMAPAALASSVEFEGRLWSPDLTGNLQVTTGITGSNIDLASDLGITDDEFPDGRFVWRPSRRTSLRLGYTSLSFDGDEVLERTITFAGSTFRVSSRVASALDLEYARFGFAWQFLSDRDGRFRFGPLVEAKGFRGEAAMTATGLTILPLTASEEFEVAFGAAGVVLDVEPSRKLAVFAEWTTLVGADEGDLTDAEAGVRYRPLRPLALSAGYRKIDIDVDDRDDLLRLDLDGLFFGVRLEF